MKPIEIFICIACLSLCAIIGILITDMKWEKAAIEKGFGTRIDGKFYWTREKVYVEESLYKEITKDKKKVDR